MYAHCLYSRSEWYGGGAAVLGWRHDVRSVQSPKINESLCVVYMYVWSGAVVEYAQESRTRWVRGVTERETFRTACVREGIVNRTYGTPQKPVPSSIIFY